MMGPGNGFAHDLTDVAAVTFFIFLTLTSFGVYRLNKYKTINRIPFALTLLGVYLCFIALAVLASFAA